MLQNSSSQPAGEQPESTRKDLSRLRNAAMAAGLVIWVFLAFMLAQAIGIVLIQGMQWVGVPLSSVDSTIFTTVANIFVYTLALALIIGLPWLIKKSRTTTEELGIKRPRWTDIAWLIGGVVAYIVLTVVVTVTMRLLLPDANYNEPQDTGFNTITTSWQFALTFISLVIVPPLAEEFIFRGYLFGKLLKYVPAAVAVLASAALFAVAHGQFNVALDTFALGIVLAVLRLKTGSIWMSVALHALKNGVAFYFLFVNPLVL